MSSVDRNRLMIALARISTARFLSITTATVTTMRKTNGERSAALKRLNPFHERVLSVRTSVYQPCYDYAGAVERARTKAIEAGNYDGPVEFETGTTWYVRVTDTDGRPTAFGEHKENGSLYFAGRELNKGKTTYIASEDIFELDDTPANARTDKLLFGAGSEIPYDAFKAFCSEYNPSAKQGLSEDDEVRPRTLKIESIRAIKCGETRVVVEMPILRNEHEAVTRYMARLLANMPDVDINSIPENLRATPTPA